MAWTEDRINILRALWKEGLTASKIAVRLGEGVTRNAVIGKAHRLGLASRPSPLKTDTTKAKPAQKKPPPPAERSKITLLQLTERMCKWPIGHPGEADFHFCGHLSTAGQPYCPHHAAMAYQSPAPRRDRRNRPGS